MSDKGDQQAMNMRNHGPLKLAVLQLFFIMETACKHAGCLTLQITLCGNQGNVPASGLRELWKALPFDCKSSSLLPGPQHAAGLPPAFQGVRHSKLPEKSSGVVETGWASFRQKQCALERGWIQWRN